MNSTTTPRIYVASLSDYNAGEYLGRWIDATLGTEHIHAEIQQMLSESKHGPAEEWAIHDFEGFEGVSLSEWSRIEDIAKLAEQLKHHGPVFGGLVEYFGGLPHGFDEAELAMVERYCGDFDSVVEFAEHFVADGYSFAVEQLPRFIRYNIDYENVARDMEMGGDIFTIETGGRVHVFWSR